MHDSDLEGAVVLMGLDLVATRSTVAILQPGRGSRTFFDKGEPPWIILQTQCGMS